MPRRRRKTVNAAATARAVGWVVVAGAMLAITSFAPPSARGRGSGGRSNEQLQALAREAQDAYAQQRYAAAADAYRRLIEAHPYDFILHFNRACALTHDGQIDAAFESLASAARYGFEDVDLLAKSKALEPLRADPRLAPIQQDVQASRDERFLVHVPPNLSPRRPVPLVVLIHGRGSSPRNVLPMWTAAAEKVGVVLALPKGVTRLDSGRYGWDPPFPTDNAQLEWAAAEAAVDRAVAAALSAHANIDRGKGSSPASPRAATWRCACCTSTLIATPGSSRSSPFTTVAGLIRGTTSRRSARISSAARATRCFPTAATRATT